jgi:hypothetical protein
MLLAALALRQNVMLAWLLRTGTCRRCDGGIERAIELIAIVKFARVPTKCQDSLA